MIQGDAMMKLQDGRRIRGRATHDKMVNACRTLMRRGALRPTAPDVASVSGVATRTVFTHFKDIRSLYAHAIEEPDLIETLLSRLPADRSELFRVMLLRDHQLLPPRSAGVSQDVDGSIGAAPAGDADRTGM
ncbi:hypothetical protein [Reyranella sp. CPCC 100927]|uniref:hypothetical protein n=1 Tax=Reyranella sp. CPCC 100927 TaxID=2599616 RepID=UPI0011B8326E|nr:hypothetical protein [Reyranella sp. CPCC 100927]TWS94294.1 hypothetical protein FQU96_41345 [Reyranella sp. CPCC 100927]